MNTKEKKKVLISLSKIDLETLSKLAEQNKRTRKQQIEHIVEQYIKNNL